MNSKIFKVDAKKIISLIIGVIICAIVNVAPLEALAPISPQGKMCLGLSLMAVVYWAVGTMDSAFVGGLFCVLIILTKTATPAQVFESWTGTIMWMVIGAYLIAGAVKESRLGERIAYIFMIRFVHSWRSLIISIYVLSVILSLLIPHPFPRGFMILVVTSVICDTAEMIKADKAKVGLAVFAACGPSSMFFLTGDSLLNPLVVSQSGIACSYIQWFITLAIPAAVATALTCLVSLVFFKPEGPINISLEVAQGDLEAMGKLSRHEIRTIIWIAIAVILWLTGSITGIDVGWATLLVSMLMALPFFGEVLEGPSWQEVPIGALIFLTAAMAIGTVGGVTGMNDWIATVCLPSSVPSNFLILALLFCVISMVLHMFMGDVLAVLVICAPSFVSFVAGTSVSPLAAAMITYTALLLHYLLPFHSLSILVGIESDDAGYTPAHVRRMGIPLTLVTIIVVLVEACWFHVLGMM